MLNPNPPHNKIPKRQRNPPPTHDQPSRNNRRHRRRSNPARNALPSRLNPPRNTTIPHNLRRPLRQKPNKPIPVVIRQRKLHLLEHVQTPAFPESAVGPVERWVGKLVLVLDDYCPGPDSAAENHYGEEADPGSLGDG